MVDSLISLWKTETQSGIASQTPVDDCEGATLAAGALTFSGDLSVALLISSMITASSHLTVLIEFVYEP